VAEGIACARAGATIIHVQAYDGGGPETHDWQVYARIIEGIRGRIDVPVYPRHGIHPNYAIYDPGFLRAGAALARAAGARTPVYRLMFCDRLLAIGFPPRPYALAAYLSLLQEEAGTEPWMIAGLNADLRPLFAETVARGGHIRVGLEDARLGTTKSNLALVEEAVRMVRDAGAEPPSPAEMRQALAAA
jgi:3-keto-5-aminohexanoate cleavage enzyme